MTSTNAHSTNIIKANKLVLRSYGHSDHVEVISEAVGDTRESNLILRGGDNHANVGYGSQVKILGGIDYSNKNAPLKNQDRGDINFTGRNINFNYGGQIGGKLNITDDSDPAVSNEVADKNWVIDTVNGIVGGTGSITITPGIAAADKSDGTAMTQGSDTAEVNGNFTIGDTVINYKNKLPAADSNTAFALGSITIGTGTYTITSASASAIPSSAYSNVIAQHSAMKANISTNSNNIATNVTNIATNTNSIATLNTAVSDTYTKSEADALWGTAGSSGSVSYNKADIQTLYGTAGTSGSVTYNRNYINTQIATINSTATTNYDTLNTNKLDVSTASAIYAPITSLSSYLTTSIAASSYVSTGGSAVSISDYTDSVGIAANYFKRNSVEADKNISTYSATQIDALVAGAAPTNYYTKAESDAKFATIVTTDALQTSINTNITNISTNSGNISTNTTNIATKASIANVTAVETTANANKEAIFQTSTTPVDSEETIGEVLTNNTGASGATMTLTATNTLSTSNYTLVSYALHLSGQISTCASFNDPSDIIISDKVVVTSLYDTASWNSNTDQVISTKYLTPTMTSYGSTTPTVTYSINGSNQLQVQVATNTGSKNIRLKMHARKLEL